MNDTPNLTSRESEILALIAQGFTNPQIADKGLALGKKMSWQNTISRCSRILGQQFWVNGQLDSAEFYYLEAMEAIDKMAAGATSPTDPDGYSQADIDDLYSQMYGTLGNLYVDREEIPEALHYYSLAGELFEKYGWHTSLAVLHNNMGELYFRQKNYKKSLEEYNISLGYGKEVNDSLWIAEPLKGMSVTYSEMGKSAKAIKAALEADKYFADNQDQEFLSRIETLDVLRNAYDTQKKMAISTAVLTGIALLLLIGIFIGRNILKRMKKEQEEASIVLDETIEELRPKPEKAKDTGIHLNDREEQILELLKQGKTTPQIADIICLSPETIKWYRKKLLAKFDVTNTAELIAKIK